MDVNTCLKLSLESTVKAKQYITGGEASRAFPHLLLALKLNPSLAEELSGPFSFCLDNLIKKLIVNRRFKDINTCLSEAISIFPQNKPLFSKFYSFITHVFPEGAVEAISIFREAITTNEWNLPALATFEDICLWAAERWHFRMINDQVRNNAFKESIARKVRSGKSDVLDIGTGSGLLSLFAVEAGAEKVYACDTLPIMVSVAEKVLSQHGAGKCTVIPKHSTKISVPTDIPNRVGLVVCEIVDSGLLGEDILQTLEHAWLNLLDPEGAVIPLSATFYMCGIQCSYISNLKRLRNYPRHLGLEDLHIVTQTEGYDTENLNSVPGGYKRLTDVVPALTVCFNSVADIQKVLRGMKDTCLSLKCCEGGTLDCVAGWFTLRLDEETQLTTEPGSTVRCWDQAIFACPTRQTLEIGQDFSILASFEAGQISVTFPEPECSSQGYMMSIKATKFLNDVIYVKLLQDTAHEFLEKEGHITIADFSPFPVFGLTVLKLRKGGDTLISNCTHDDQRIVEKLAEASGCEVKFMTVERIAEQENVCDIVLLDVIDEMGYLNIGELKTASKFVKENGDILPKKLSVWGQLVESDWLRRVSRVENTSSSCQAIVQLMNDYRIFHHIDLRLESIAGTNRSDPFPLLHLDLLKDCNIDDTCAVPITEEGRMDAMIYWYDLNITSSSTSFSTKSSTRINLASILMDEYVSGSVNLKTVYEDGYFITRVISDK